VDRKNPVFCSVFRSLALIEENIQEKLTIAMLAESVHFSKYYYQRIFREAVGDSVMRYVARRRLTMAAQELAQTNQGILEIALKYGYESHEGFTRSFRTYMGVTPMEYRKYHLFMGISKMEENWIMIKTENAKYAKTISEIIKELNCLIVLAKETAQETRKFHDSMQDQAACYRPFWNFIAQRAEIMADKLTKNVERISAIAQSPDEISTRFIIIEAIEEFAFCSYSTAFQAELVMARALPEHRELFCPLCEKYCVLAQKAQIKLDKMAAFLKELSELIFQDMRSNAKQQIQNAVEKGNAVAHAIITAQENLTNKTDMTYCYIAEEIAQAAQELAQIPLEEITVPRLEELLTRLDIIAFATEMEVLRMPSHQFLLVEIDDFRRQIEEAVIFFQTITGDMMQEIFETKGNNAQVAAHNRKYCNMILQSNMLLFYLKGEIQKLGSRFLEKKQKAALDSICSQFAQVIQLAKGTSAELDKAKIQEGFQALYKDLTTQAQQLGTYGGAVEYIAEKLNELLLTLNLE